MTTTENLSVKQQIDAVTNDFFAAVTFSEGEKPAYQNLRTIFIESGLLIRNLTASPEVSTVEQFIAPRQKSVDAGDLTAFREAELSEITEIFGNVAQRFSTYEKSGVNKGVAIAGRGVISIQFVNTEDGWKMSSMAWDDEREGLTIPERYK